MEKSIKEKVDKIKPLDKGNREMEGEIGTATVKVDGN